ncbi:MAG: lipopolysaccharide kinase InaA family protein [Kiritimatiellia bacterium]
MTSPLPPSRLSPSFFREAGRACAWYVQNGGRLRDIQWEEVKTSAFPLQLTPPPLGGRVLYPVRVELETDLEALRHRWRSLLLQRPASGLRFLFGFCAEMEKQSSGWKNWLRIWCRQQEAAMAQQISQHYQQLLSRPDIRQQPCLAHWEPYPELNPEVLKDMLEERIALRNQALSHSSRAVVVESELLGEPVIIKRYAANPKSWKRRWEHSRARRAWAAARIMEEMGMPAIHGLGWVEQYDKGRLQQSYFICRQLHAMETLRTWLRREFRNMNEAEKGQFRHRLRREILKLQQRGLMHIDLKLSNLLVKGERVEDLVFYWIDLEDLRPGSRSQRNFIRNLYQLNGSLPREIPFEQRRAFVAGFHSCFRFSDSPRLLKYIQRKTRKRHRDELRRLQGA